MSEITTMKGLPNIEQVLPDFFERICCLVKHPFNKASFKDECGWYCTVSGCTATLSTDDISTVIVKDKTGKPLMYAYVIECEEKYVLMEIGNMQAYQVDKDKIDIEKVAYHRLPFAHTEKGLVIMVRDDKDETHVHELWLRDLKTKEESKLDFSGGGIDDGLKFLQKQGLALISKK